MAKPGTLVGQVEFASDLLNDRREGRAALGIADAICDQRCIPVGSGASHGNLNRTHTSTLRNQRTRARWRASR